MPLSILYLFKGCNREQKLRKDKRERVDLYFEYDSIPSRLEPKLRKMKHSCYSWLLVLFLLLCTTNDNVQALRIVLAGGTGRLGRNVAATLQDHTVTILSRNAFLASTPTRVTEQFGWLGYYFLEENPHVALRDWDGGDLTDIVGCDFLGWQDETLPLADVVVNLVGGYTKQREMATERLVRESIRLNPMALQITVSPKVEDLKALTPGAFQMKVARLQLCEDMVMKNCIHSKALRLNAFDTENSVQIIVESILSGRQN
jgi:hypothetical protein